VRRQPESSTIMRVNHRCPHLAAQCTAFSPEESTRSMRAPRSSSRSHTTISSFRTASISGVILLFTVSRALTSHLPGVTEFCECLEVWELAKACSTVHPPMAGRTPAAKSAICSPAIDKQFDHRSGPVSYGMVQNSHVPEAVHPPYMYERPVPSRPHRYLLSGYHSMS
jgi:hypothetical protein